MTMTDGERAIVAQLKRIADALEGVDKEKTFADPAPRSPFVEPYRPPYQPPYQPWWNPTFTGPTWTTGGAGYASGGIVHHAEIDPNAERVEPRITPFVETNDRVWEHIMRGTEGDGDHLLNPEADKTGEDVD